MAGLRREAVVSVFANAGKGKPQRDFTRIYGERLTNITLGAAATLLHEASRKKRFPRFSGATGHRIQLQRAGHEGLLPQTYFGPGTVLEPGDSLFFNK